MIRPLILFVLENLETPYAMAYIIASFATVFLALGVAAFELKKHYVR